MEWISVHKLFPSHGQEICFVENMPEVGEDDLDNIHIGYYDAKNYLFICIECQAAWQLDKIKKWMPAKDLEKP